MERIPGEAIAGQADGRRDQLDPQGRAAAFDRMRPRSSLVWIGLLVLAALLVWALSDVVLVVLFAALLAIVLRGSADWLAARTGAPPRLMLAAVTLLVFCAVIGLGYWIGPRLAGQGQELAGRLASQIDAFRAHLAQTGWGKPLANGLSTASGGAEHLLGPAETALVITFRTIADLVILLVTSLYFAISPELYVRGLVRLVPIPHRPRARKVLADTAAALRRWVLGQFVDMATVGVLAAIGLRVVGVPEPYALALLAGLLTFVPYFGAIIAAVPALIVAATVSWSTALWTVVVFLACHAAEGYLVAPIVQRRLVDLPPAISIVAMTVMGTLFGPLGVVLGTPVAAAGLVLLREVYFAQVLGDRADPEDAAAAAAASARTRGVSET